jgi:hypothetical protein
MKSLAAIIIFSLVASALCLKFAPNPYIWVFTLWAAVFSRAAWLLPNPTIRAVCVNLAVVALFGYGAETYFWLEKREPDPSAHATSDAYRMEGSILDGYRDMNHPVLGYAPVKGVSAEARKYYGDQLIYDVVYTIDQNGLRHSPPVRTGIDPGCVLFFGGSFTYGEGVQDEETMPYRVGILTEGRFQIYNFGFHGYGPHQMLAALESGLVAEAAPCEPDFVIYQGLDRHVLRTAGLVAWGKNGPRYVLSEDGNVQRAGTLEDKVATQGLLDSALRQLGKSNIYTWALGRSSSYQIRDKQIQVFGGILQGARDYLTRVHPDAAFHVLLWEFDNALAERVLEELWGRDLPVHRITRDVLPRADYRSTYALGPYDHHPNPEAYDLVARYVVGNILVPASDVEN